MLLQKYNVIGKEEVYAYIKEKLKQELNGKEVYTPREFVSNLRLELSKKGIELNSPHQNAILGIISCRDEVVKIPEGLRDLNYMDFSSLGALYISGKEGLEVLAHHLPEEKDKWIVLLHLPHIGYDMENEKFGYIRRKGQKSDSPCCGAHAFLKESKKVSGKNLNPYTELHLIYQVIANKAKVKNDPYEWTKSLYKENAFYLAEALIEVVKENALMGFFYLPYLQVHVQDNGMKEEGIHYDVFIPLEFRIFYQNDQR